jgi:pimeloyl-ACP methyl ester carboxylesterase
MPDARLEVISGAAHAPFLSQPERFTQLLREFAQ